ncbi:MAG TPA: hypothetical protein VI759_07340 [Dehalococcoidia bacterium]|nr:hypothetical protein [Dehalococcoidia bacterium]
MRISQRNIEQAIELGRAHGLPSAIAKHMGVAVTYENRGIMALAAGKRVDAVLWRLPGHAPQIVVADHLSRADAEASVGHELAHAFGVSDEVECDAIAGAMLSALRPGDLVEQPDELRNRVFNCERRSREAAALEAGRAARARRVAARR